MSVIEMKDPIIISPSMKCQTAMEIMNDRNVDQLPVVDADGSISGNVTWCVTPCHVVCYAIKFLNFKFE